MRIAVIGAGVIGLTSAVAIKEAFPSDIVTIFSDDFSPNTTGDGSAGLWGPYALSNNSMENVIHWSEKTHKWMEMLWKSDLAVDVGISLIPVIRLYNDDEEHKNISSWIQVVYGGIFLNQTELKKMNGNFANFKYAYHFLTYTCEPTKLLPWLMKKFVLLGGQVKQQFIQSFNDLENENFDVIINCTGLGASKLVTDKSLIPIRGQVIRVKAPWIYEVILEDVADGNYIIPNIDSVVLGGTRQKGDFDTSVRKEDSKFIYEGCFRINPSIKKTQTLIKWTGLRPGRSEIRLESEKYKTLNGLDITVIHNYGHGGSGVTLCWGCALDVVRILRELRVKNTAHL